MKVRFKRVYKNFSIGDKANIDKKEELDYLINTKTVDILENFVTSELEEEKTVDKTESPKEKSNSKGKSKK